MTVSLIYPLFLWSADEDMTAWTLSNVTRTAGQSGPMGGTNAVLLNDTSAVAEAYAASPSVAVTSASLSNQTTVQLYLKAGTATSTRVGLYDAVAVAYRIDVTVTWSGGVPTCAVTNGSGSVLAPISVGTGWYFIEFHTPNVASTTNNHNLIIHPADTTGATGTVYAYIRPTVLLEVLDDVLVWDEPRPGYATVQGASGVEDAWWVGTDHHASFTARWIPARSTDSPGRVSGWDGNPTAKWLNQGVQSMLIAGMQKDVLYFAPNRSSPTSDTAVCYLVDAAAPTLEPNGLRSVPIHLRADPSYAVVGRRFEALIA